MLKIGAIDYINALPLIGAIKHKIVDHSHEIIFDIPSKLNALLNSGEIDLGLVSSAEFLDSSRYNLFSTYGIAAHGPILSVNLYLKRTIKDLNNATVGLTHHSKTSIDLLKVLAQHYWKVTPIYEPLNRDSSDSYEAFLLIGDEALHQVDIDGFHKIDLAEAWYHSTGLPFVFALFAVRKESLEPNAQELETFHSKLNESYAWYQANSQQLISFAQQKSGLSTDLIEKYYRNCRYTISAKELEGLYKFGSLRNTLSSKHT